MCFRGNAAQVDLETLPMTKTKRVAQLRSASSEFQQVMLWYYQLATSMDVLETPVV